MHIHPSIPSPRSPPKHNTSFCWWCQERAGAGRHIAQDCCWPALGGEMDSTRFSDSATSGRGSDGVDDSSSSESRSDDDTARRDAVEQFAGHEVAKEESGAKEESDDDDD
ncbi:unnamed protein product, partial [Ectocarpus fasciculatus]